MSAIINFSTKFDDPDAIVADLTANGAGCAPADTLGFLHCDSQIDYEGVLSRLSGQAAFPIVGGTTMAFPFAGKDGSPVSASLLLVRKEGMCVSVAFSEKLDPAAHQRQVRETYDLALAGLRDEPRLIMPFFPLQPGFPTQIFIDGLQSLAGETPLFGGVTTNDLISTRAAIFAGGKVLYDRMALIMLGGAVQPVFSTGNKVSPMVEYAPIVTRVKGHEVFTVDGRSFCDYMRSIGIRPEQRVNGVDALMQYGPTPVLVQNPGTAESDVPEVRCISYTNLEHGSAVFSAPIAEGSKLRMSILRKQDVIDSATDCLNKLQERMRPAQEKGYVYSALFYLPCVARYFVFVGEESRERETLRAHPLFGLCVSSSYMFCEIGPVYGKKDQRMLNGAHSASVVMCAL